MDVIHKRWGFKSSTMSSLMLNECKVPEGKINKLYHFPCLKGMPACNERLQIWIAGTFWDDDSIPCFDFDDMFGHMVIYMTIYVCQNSLNHMFKKGYIIPYVSYSLINLTFKTNKKMPPFGFKQAVQPTVAVARPIDFINQEFRIWNTWSGPA